MTKISFIPNENVLEQPVLGGGGGFVLSYQVFSRIGLGNNVTYLEIYAKEIPTDHAIDLCLLTKVKLTSPKRQ